MAFADSGVRAVLDAQIKFTVTLGEAVQAGDLLANVAGTYYLADANNSRYATAVACQDGDSGDEIMACRKARINGISGGTAGNPLYLSDTAGNYSESAGTVPQIVGEEISTTEAWVEPERFSSVYAYLALTLGVQSTGETVAHAAFPVAGDVVRVLFTNSTGGALTSAAKVTVAGIGTAFASSGATLADGGVTNTTTIGNDGTNVARGTLLVFTVGGSDGKRQPQSATVLVRYLVGATQ